MSRAPKTLRARLLPRKTAATARNFPAWIDGDARAIVLPATVEPRVRDNLVLRVVAKGKHVHPKATPDVRRAS
jgi:hypothetical protein